MCRGDQEVQADQSEEKSVTKSNVAGMRTAVQEIGVHQTDDDSEHTNAEANVGSQTDAQQKNSQQHDLRPSALNRVQKVGGKGRGITAATVGFAQKQVCPKIRCNHHHGARNQGHETNNFN